MTTITTPVRLLSTASLTWAAGHYGEPPRLTSTRHSGSYSQIIGGERVWLSVAHLTGVAVDMQAGDGSSSAIASRINSVLNAAYATVGLTYAASVSADTYYVTDPISGSQLRASGSSGNDYEKLGLPSVSIDTAAGARTGTDLTSVLLGAWWDQVSLPVTVPSGTTHATLHLRLSASTVTPVSATVGTFYCVWDVAGHGGPPPYVSGSSIIQTGLGLGALGSTLARLSGSVPRNSSDFGDFNANIPFDALSFVSYIAGDPDLMFLVAGRDNNDKIRSHVLELPVPLGANRMRLVAANAAVSGSHVPCTLSASVALGWRVF